MTDCEYFRRYLVPYCEADIRVRTHPGEILREEFLVPMGIDARKLAVAIGLTESAVYDLIQQRQRVDKT